MVAITASLPSQSTSHPPVVLVHGAANSASVWRYWQDFLVQEGWPTYAIDLRGHGKSVSMDLSHTRMSDYVEDVHHLIGQFNQKALIWGWSMGGLVALMLASAGEVAGCVALAPSTPARQEDPAIELQPGVFTSKEYGITSLDPQEQPAMLDLSPEERVLALSSLGEESHWARCERKRGVVIESLACPFLLVTGSRDSFWPSSRYEGLWLPADRIEAEASHWGLVLSRQVISSLGPQIVAWMSTTLPSVA